MQVRKQRLELDMEQQTGSKQEKEYSQGCILSPCLFNFYAVYIQLDARLDATQAESRLLKEVSITSDTQMTPPLWQKRRTKEPLDESE